MLCRQELSLPVLGCYERTPRRLFSRRAMCYLRLVKKRAYYLCLPRTAACRQNETITMAMEHAIPNEFR